MKIKKFKNKSYDKLEKLYIIIIQKYARGYITRNKIGRIVMCSICLQFNLNNQNRCKFTCLNKHIFHEQCLNQWLNFKINKKNLHDNNSCPVCRSIIYTNKNNENYYNNDNDNSESDYTSQTTEENISIFTIVYSYFVRCFRRNNNEEDSRSYCCCF